MKRVQSRVVMRDSDVRHALRQRLEAQHATDESKIVDELGLCQGVVRVDIAVINGSLSGFEIKSEADTMTRWPRQQEAYFLDARTPWHRQLWNIGLSLTLKEVLEAAAAVRASVLSAGALEFLAGNGQRMVGTDPGAGSTPESQALQAALRSKLRPEGLAVIAQQQAALTPVYLSRWADTLRKTNGRRARERA